MSSAQLLSRLATLATLDLPPNTSALVAEFDAMRTLLEALATVDTTGVTPFAHDLLMAPGDTAPASLALDELLALAPDHHGSSIRVPGVFAPDQGS